MAAAGDIKISPTCCHLHLRKTKICQRLAFNELVSVENDYLRELCIFPPLGNNVTLKCFTPLSYILSLLYFSPLHYSVTFRYPTPLNCIVPLV